MTKDARDDREQVLEDVATQLTGAAQELVPWFFENMPSYYFRTHTREEVTRHLRGIISGQALDEAQDIVFTSQEGTRVTYVTPGGDLDSLIKVLKQVADRDIQTARIYSSRDKKLRLDAFLFDPQCRCDPESEKFSQAVAEMREKALVDDDNIDRFKDFLSGAGQDYVDKFEAHRALRHLDMCCTAQATERVHVGLEKEVQDNYDRIMVAMTDPPSKGLMLQAVKVFARRGIIIQRAYGDVFQHGGRRVAVFSFYVENEYALEPGEEVWEGLKSDLKRIKWLPRHDFERLADEDGWTLEEVMLLQAACEFAHQFLLRTDLYAYNSSRIVSTMLRHRDMARDLVDYFHAKFDPAIEVDREALIKERRDAIRHRLALISNDIQRNIFGCILRFFRYTLRTNFYLPNHFGLSFRLDPMIVKPGPDEERPFGIYCFHGPYCFGFQVRYRDMARGGVRVVRTWSQEHFELESNRLFDEVTKLASTQQAKNKDIPEGGSKAVILLGPDGDIDLAVKSMIDSLLDLMLTSEGRNTLPEVVDYVGKEEIIYLGPDENITPHHIEWAIERAAKRGYAWPNALMSSKPATGINHKEFGVTSEGVIVFAEEVLKSLGIDPRKRPFTVKLTGGPAGDVASNCMKILMREFGSHAIIVAMSDGHGAAYDPEGLQHKELLRLIDAGERAHQYDPKLLKGKGAFVITADNPEGKKIRDDLHNQAMADIFIPSGGRPDTINSRNWKRFLRPYGTPTAKAIVEGANIFISPDARDNLEERGVVIVAGASANKTGVICSSYEILAGLVLSDQEFLDMKAEYVPQVLDILRTRARDEARVILSEYKRQGGRVPLTAISRKLSLAINQLSDDIGEVLEEDMNDLAKHPRLAELILHYCPEALADNYSERILNKVPKRYLLSLLGAFIASRILYMEGLDWFEGIVAIHDTREVVYAYLEEEKHVAHLANQVRESDITGKDAILSILTGAGRKHLLLEKLGLD